MAAAERVKAAPDTRAAESRARLLEAATDHYDAHGGGPCPMCRSGVLDQHWPTEAEAQLDRIRDDAAARRLAAEGLAGARRAVRALPAAQRAAYLW